MKKIIYLLLLLLLVSACEQWNLDKEKFYELTTGVEIDVEINLVNIVSEIKGIDSEALNQHGHVWSSSIETPTIELNDGIDEKGGLDTDQSFTSVLDKLKTNTIYYVRSFAEFEDQIVYGNSIAITTGNILVTTDTLVYTAGREADVYGQLCCVGLDIPVNQHGFCWSSVNELPTIEKDPFVNLGELEMNGSFSGTISGLEDTTTYYYRSYAITNFGAEIIYGEVKSWDTRLVDVWAKKENIPISGIFYSSFSYNGKGYVFDGNRLHIYNPNLDTWSLSNSAIPNTTTVIAPVIFVLDDFAYFLIGSQQIFALDTQCWKFDLVNDQWEQLGDFEGTPRFFSVGFAPGNGKMYVGLGATIGGLSGEMWEYNPNGDTWIQLPDLHPGPLAYHRRFSFFADGLWYVGGGLDSAPTVYSFNYQTGDWAIEDDLPTGETYDEVSFTIGQKAYLGTGTINGNEFSSNFWALDQTTNTWARVSNLPGESRWGAFAFSIGNKAYVGGGHGQNTWLTDFWEYKAEVD